MQGAGAPTGFGGIGHIAIAAVGNLGIGQAQGLHRAVGPHVLRADDARDLDHFSAFGQAEFFLAAHHQVAIGQDLNHGDRQRTFQGGFLVGHTLAFAGLARGAEVNAL